MYLIALCSWNLLGLCVRDISMLFAESDRGAGLFGLQAADLGDRGTGERLWREMSCRGVAPNVATLNGLLRWAPLHALAQIAWQTYICRWDGSGGQGTCATVA